MLVKCCICVFQMKPDVDIFFSDPIDILKRQHEQLMKVNIHCIKKPTSL